MSKGPYILLVDFTIHDGKMDLFLEEVVRNANASVRGEPGCRRFDVLRPEGAGDRVLLYEIYDDEAAFEAHRGTPHFHAFDAAAAPLVKARSRTQLRLVNPQ